MKKIFISHSSADEKIVESFVSNILRLGINIKREEIFCSSVEGMKIASGEDWRQRIKDEITEANVILLLVSPNYKASEICLNEMGAAYVSDAAVIPLILGDITYKSVGVIVEPKQIEKLDEDGLNHLCEKLKEIFPKKANSFNVSVWDSKKRKFLEEMRNFIAKKPFPPIYSQEEIKEEILKRDTLQADFDTLLEEKEKLSREIEHLKQCKDAKEVAEVEKEFEDTSVLEQFSTLLNEVRTNLREIPAAARTLVFNDLCNKRLNVSGYMRELAEAEAKNLIEERNEEYVPVYKKATMKHIRSAIEELKVFIEEVSADDWETLSKQYDSLEVDDLEFWEKVIGVSMSFTI